MSAVRCTSVAFLIFHLSLSLLLLFVDAKLVDMKVNLGGEAVDGFTSEEEVIELPNSENIAKMRFHGSIKNGGAFSNVFRTQRFSRYEDLVLNFPVPDGVYHVELLFAETWKGAFSQGKRVFDVYMGSKPNGIVKVLSQFDPFREGGPGGAIYKKFDGVVTQDGLTVALRPITQNPQIAGVIISGYSYSPALIEDLPTVTAAIPPSEDFNALNNIGARLPADPSLLYDPAQNPKFKNGGGPPSTSSFVSTASPPSASDMSLGVSNTQGTAQPYGSVSAVGSSSNAYGTQSGYGDAGSSTPATHSSTTGYGTSSMGGGGSDATGGSPYSGGSTDGQTQGGQSSQPSQYGGPAPQYGVQSSFGAQGSFGGGQASQYGGGQVSQYSGGQASQYGSSGTPQFGGAQNSQYGGAAGYGQTVYRRRLSSFPEPEGASAPDFPVRMEPANRPMMNMQGGVPPQWGSNQNGQRTNSYMGAEMPNGVLQNDGQHMRVSHGGISSADMSQEGTLQNDAVRRIRDEMTPSKLSQEGTMSGGMESAEMRQSELSQTGFSQADMSQGGMLTGGMIPNAMAQGGNSPQRMSHLGQESNSVSSEMPGMGNVPGIQSQDMTRRSMSAGDPQMQEYIKDAAPSPSPSTIDSANGIPNMRVEKGWSEMSSMSNSYGVPSSVQQEAQADVGVPTSSGPAADQSIIQSAEGRDAPPQPVSSSMDSMASTTRSSLINPYDGQIREESTHPQNILSHREFQAQSERMQQAMDAAAVAAAMVSGNTNDGSINRANDARKYSQPGSLTESRNDVGGFTKGFAGSPYDGNYGPGSGMDRGTASNDLGKETNSRYEMADGTGQKIEPANGINTMQHRTSEHLPSRDSRSARSMSETLSGPDSVDRLPASNTEQLSSSDDGANPAGRWGRSGRGLRSGESVNLAVRTMPPEEPISHSQNFEYGNGPLNMGRTVAGTAVVDAGRGALQAVADGGNEIIMGTSAGIHNGDQQLDGICLNNQTHCSCGEIAPDATAGERCLFVKNEESSPMICVRGPCSGKWKCGCSPDANNMCVQSLVKSILVAVPGRSPSPENDIVLCRREVLDEGMHVLTPVF